MNAKLYEYLTRTSMDAYFVMDMAGNILEVNDAATRMYGYSKEELLTLSIHDIEAGESEEETRQHIENVIAEGFDRFESRHFDKFGNTVDVEVSASFVPESNLFLAFYRDVTEKKRLGQELLSANSLLETHFANSPLAVIEFNALLKIVRWTGRAEHFFGWTADEVLGKSFDEFRWNYEEDIPNIQSVIDRAVSGSSPRELNVNRNYRKDGTVVWCEWYSSGLYDNQGRLSSLLCIAQDITEKKVNEDKLLASEERYRFAMDATNDGIWDWDVTSGRVDYSPMWNTILAIKAVVPSYETWASRIHTDDREAVLQGLQAHLAGETPSWSKEHRLQTTDGVWKWVLGRGSVVLRDEEGNPLRMVGTMTDISERKLVEERLKASEESYRYLSGLTSDYVHKCSRTGSAPFRIQWVGGGIDSITGYASDEIFAKGCWLPLIHPDDRQKVADYLFSLTPGDVKQIEFRLLTKQGEVLRILEKSRCIAGEQEGELILLGAATDITEKRVTEEKLLETQELFSNFLKYSPVYTFIKRIEGQKSRVIQLSDNFIDMLGRSADELRGHTMEEMFPPEFARKITEDDIAVLQTGKVAQLDEEFNGRSYITIKFPIQLDGQSSYMAGYTIDVSERKLAEQRMRESEEKYRSIVKTSQDWIWEMDLEGNHTFSNDRVLDILGYDTDDFLQMDLLDLVHPDDLQEVSRRLPQLIAEKSGWRGWVLRWRRMDGGYRFLESSANPILNESGEIQGFRGVDRDITERKTAEAQIRESEKRFRTLLESVPNISIQGYRGDGTVLYWNKASENVYGYSQDEALGRNLLDLIIPPEMRDDVRKAIRNGADTGEMPPAGELQLLKKDGSRVPVFSSHAVVRVPEREPELFCIDIDFSERYELLAELENSIRELQALLNLLPIGAGWMDETGNVKFLNKAFVDQFGYTIHDIPTLSDWFERAYPEKSYRDSIISWYADNVASVGKEAGIPPLEVEITCKDGTTKNVLILASNVMNRIVGVYVDLTDRKKSEQERLQLEQQLLHAQKLESLGVLAGGIAHDFNNILTSIVGNTELALLHLPNETPARDNLNRVEKAAMRATDLAKQMLAYSGRGKFVVENIDLNRLIEEMGRMLEVSISKKVTLRYNLTRQLPLVHGDVTQIRQVLMNLVINASEAIGDSDGVVAISTGSVICDSQYLKDIWSIEELHEGLYVFAEVADTGCGMSSDVIARLFDPFFTTKFTGRGLGMAAVMGIVRGHHGAITVQSEVGRGTTFQILLPASSLEEEKSPSQETVAEWHGAGRVLLVDDEETVRDTGSEMLRNLGFEVVTATNGVEALDIFGSRNDIGIVLLDLTMPLMDGIQCFKALKTIKPDVKVILSSGFNEQEVTRQGDVEGLAGFIQKPYRLTDLQAVLTRL